MKSYKFISRLIVGIALIILAGVLIFGVIRTVVFPKLPVKGSSDYINDVANSMADPDKTYARNAIEKAARMYKIAIVLDYQLTSFEVSDTYTDKIVNSIVNNIYRNQPYIIYTYFRDSNKLVITTNIDNEEKGVIDVTKEGIDTDARIVKEILYYQQNLDSSMGIQKWNFNLNTEAMRNVSLASIGSILFLILGFGVLPTSNEGFSLRRKRKKVKNTPPPSNEE